MYVNKRSGTQWVKGKTYDWDDNDFNHTVNKVNNEKCIRDSTGTGELLSRGRGTCMGYLNNRCLLYPNGATYVRWELY